MLGYLNVIHQLISFLVWVMLRKAYGGLNKAPTKEERGKRTAKRRER